VTGDSVRVAVVDDQELVRSAFTLLLRASDGVEVVGEAATGREAVVLARQERPDVVLMDVRMPGMDGLEATRAIVADERCAGTRVLVLTTFDDDALVQEAIRSGASGYLLKDVRPRQLLDAIEVVARGDALLSPSVTRRLITLFAALPYSPAAADGPDVAGLTDREVDVLRAVARGLSNQEIGAELHIGYGTVKTYVSSLLAKLGCRDRAQLVMYAYESGVAVPRGGH
jgi:DNA-binding NarL/FixJ family response regulator